MKILKTLAVAGMLASLSACIIVTDRENVDLDWDDSTDSGTASWKQKQRENREVIAELEVGASVEMVKSELGSPDFSESFSDGGNQYLILRYRTHHRHSDGETSADETTALVFEAGLLTGWGDAAMKSHGF
jgi:hypothetical protein